MDTNGLGIDQELFSCCICLDLLKDPVTIPCGHSYCMSCVNTHWNGEVGKQSYSCPQCRQNFTQRPVLVKNTMLALLMEGLKKSGPPAAPVAHCSAAHGDVSCDLCSVRKVKAVKSCLQCLVSYCKEHLQPHYDVAALKKHRLVEPTDLQDNICSIHDEVMKMFCRTDQLCICYHCCVDVHEGHDIVTAAAERTEKQRELEAFRKKILQRIDNKEKNVSSLQHEVKNVLRSANAAVDYSDRGLKELITLLEKRINDMKMQIRSQQEAKEHRVKELQDKLQQEITELKRTQSELASLSHIEDPLQFLHKFASISKVCETSESSYTCRTPPPFQDMVTSALSELRSKLQEPCQLKPPTVAHNLKVNNPKRDNGPAGAQDNVPSQQNTSVDRPAPTRTIIKQTPSASNSQPYQPADTFSPQHKDGSNFQTLGELQQFSRRLTFDPNTLNHKLQLSADNTVVKRLSQSQKYSYHPLRFKTSSQVVSKQKITSRCFWQVVGKFDEGFAVAVCSKSAVREMCRFGLCDQSWALECYKDKYVLWHNRYGSNLPFEESHCDFTEIRIGVFVDHRAGTLSFYRIFSDDSIYFIHKVETSFLEPLVAGVTLEDIDSTATLL
ncbi:E3 ubiquitin/ISG15 ligase TRIM25-like [Periophthalmus magnuspinnatus]|uniref:E3 ubiquitin/ISG15 ligase TRIM25-like n=1 Tax=Periophthalmus magnuspinnatus TaxID=409849 RepID=UPI00145A4C8B|nr:E3 ubiquitin/ISG15 ligase TRIM25-like [Periophthalmus magnuspinnatus]